MFLLPFINQRLCTIGPTGCPKMLITTDLRYVTWQKIESLFYTISWFWSKQVPQHVVKTQKIFQDLSSVKTQQIFFCQSGYMFRLNESSSGQILNHVW